MTTVGKNANGSARGLGKTEFVFHILVEIKTQESRVEKNPRRVVYDLR